MRMTSELRSSFKAAIVVKQYRLLICCCILWTLATTGCDTFYRVSTECEIRTYSSFSCRLELDSFTGDRDGPVSRFVNGVNNYFAIYNRDSPDGFKFFEHDSEHTLDVGFPDLAEQTTTNGSQFRYFNPLWMHEQLATTNSEYRLRLADRVYALTSNGPLSEESTTRLIDQRAGQIDKAIIAESA